MQAKFTEKLFFQYRELSLSGRYITPKNISPSISRLSKFLIIEEIGRSVRGNSISSISLGSGPVKILLWSQMHGNESTTTKALFDMINCLITSEEEEIKYVLQTCTLTIIPILNPDGAEDYTRHNANGIDLNRDSVDLSQPESLALRNLYNKIEPDFCFNLHGQRTIFSAGSNPTPATVSFLAPASDPEKSVPANRGAAMKIIIGLAESLQEIIPNSVGIYDDSFNINCVGDMFQSLGSTTILFEAGHHSKDYNREYTRYLMFHSLITSLNSISTGDYKNSDILKYDLIPQNQKLFYDLIIRNAEVVKEGLSIKTDIAIQYEEVLIDQQVKFQPKIEKISELKNYYGHKEFNANGHRVSGKDQLDIQVGYANDFVWIKNEKYSLLL